MLINKNMNYFIRMYRISSKAYLRVSYSLEEVIIGSMLGDLSIEKPGINSNSRLQFKQSIKNRVYIEHLFDLFEEYCGSKPLIISKFDDRPNKFKKYSSIGFKTLCLPCFNTYREKFYQFDGIKYTKVVPEDLDYHLTSKGLAYWIMDDGYKSRKGIYLCTESFTIKDHKILINVLKNKFYLNCNIHKTTNGNRIYIPSSSKERLISLIKPYLLPHFNYKIDI